MKVTVDSVRAVLAAAMALGASDVHISPAHQPVFRLAGQLRVATDFEPLSAKQIRALIEQLQVQSCVAEHSAIADEVQGQSHWILAYADLGVRVRITAYSTMAGSALALRLLSSQPPKPDEILMPEFLRQLSPFASGLVLVTGPTGSGKSTTLASWIERCSTQLASHIVTIEDPIEYIFTHGKGLVHQCELGTHFAGYHDALTDILRRDPDVLMLGELRDQASVELALRAAETGHLVLGTLHSANAVDAISRMVDIFPAQSRGFIRHMLSTVLLGVVSQRLLPSNHASAKQGRVANYEVLATTTAVKHLISEQKEVQLQAVMQTGAVHKMFTFEQNYQDLLGSGWISGQLDTRQGVL